jgi:hypothetical protein
MVGAMADKRDWQAIHERIAKGWTLYPPPPFDASFYEDVPVLEFKWPTPLGWMTLAEYNRRMGVSAAALAAPRSVAQEN